MDEREELLDRGACLSREDGGGFGEARGHEAEVYAAHVGCSEERACWTTGMSVESGGFKGMSKRTRFDMACQGLTCHGVWLGRCALVGALLRQGRSHGADGENSGDPAAGCFEGIHRWGALWHVPLFDRGDRAWFVTV